MDRDFQTQFNTANKWLEELEALIKNNLNKEEISPETKEVTQDILQKIKHLLDQAMHKFFEKHYYPHLSETDRKGAKVYFPIVSKKNSIKSTLGRGKMNDLEKKHLDFYVFIDSVQPYNNKDYLWLGHLGKYAAKKHVGLVPQKLNVTGVITAVSGVENFLPLEEKIANIFHKKSLFRIKLKKSKKVVEFTGELRGSIFFENSDVNVLWLCRKSVKDGYEIVKRILEFCDS